MKILQINCVYRKGSTGYITASIHRSLLAAGEQSAVLYGRGERFKEPFIHKTCMEAEGKANNVISRLTGLIYGGCLISTFRLIRRIRKEKPDLIHLQCINGYFVNIYKLVSFLKAIEIPTVLTLHAEFMYTANCSHALGCEKWMTGCGHCSMLRYATNSLLFDRTAESVRKMTEAFDGFENLVVVGPSQWIIHRANNSVVLKKAKMKVINNGIDTETFFPRNTVDLEMKKFAGKRKIILYATSSFDYLKGGDLFLKLIDSLDSNKYAFVVAGVDTLTGAGENVLVLGKITDRNRLAEAYSTADVTISCSRQDNYPTVCLESAACGTPVVGFDVGGVAETIQNGFGIVVQPENITDMAKAIDSLCSISKTHWCARVTELHQTLSDQRMVEKYLSLYRSILGGELYDEQ